MTDGASPGWEQADPSAEDEEALYGAHTPVWAVPAATPEAGVSWAAEPPPEEPSEAPEDGLVPPPPPPAPAPEPKPAPSNVAAPVPAAPAPAAPAPDLTSVLAG